MTFNTASPHRNYSRCWNINQLAISCPFRVCLRTRLTLIWLTLIRKPWVYGVNVFHINYRYLCLHFLLKSLQHASPHTFAADFNAPLPHVSERYGLELRFMVWCPIIFRAGSLDQWAVTHSLNEWLLPSQHPGCYRNPTSFDQLNHVLGTLVANLGYFPLGHGPYRPQPHCRRYLLAFGVCQGLVGGEAP